MREIIDYLNSPFRFRLWHLFVAMFLVAVIFGLANCIAQAHRLAHIQAVKEAYVSGRLDREQAREDVGDVVDTWDAPRSAK